MHTTVLISGWNRSTLSSILPTIHRGPSPSFFLLACSSLQRQVPCHCSSVGQKNCTCCTLIDFCLGPWVARWQSCGLDGHIQHLLRVQCISLWRQGIVSYWIRGSGHLGTLSSHHLFRHLVVALCCLHKRQKSFRAWHIAAVLQSPNFSRCSSLKIWQGVTHGLLVHICTTAARGKLIGIMINQQ